MWGALPDTGQGCWGPLHLQSHSGLTLAQRWAGGLAAKLELGWLSAVMVAPSGGCSGKYSFPCEYPPAQLVPGRGWGWGTLWLCLGISKHQG